MHFIARPLASLSLASLLLASCATVRPPPASGAVDHVVFVWLKRPGHAEDRAALIEASQALRDIPGLRALDVGTALPSPRPVVDDSFDLGFVMRFDSAAALKAYETHPRHLAARDRLMALSRSVLVYDITHASPPMR